MAEVVADASAVVDLLLGNELGLAVAQRIRGHAVHSPAHVDAEVLSALGRLHRAGALQPEHVDSMLRALASAPIHRHPVASLLIGAWGRRHLLRLADAVYVELAMALGVRLVTTDRRLRPVTVADVVTG